MNGLSREDAALTASTPPKAANGSLHQPATMNRRAFQSQAHDWGGGPSAKPNIGGTGGATVIPAMVAGAMPMVAKMVTKSGETRSSSSNHGD